MILHPSLKAVILGANAVVLGPIRVGHRAVIAAVSVGTRDVADGAVVAGIPAKPIRRRELSSVTGPVSLVR